MDLREYFGRVFDDGSFAHFYLLSDELSLDETLAVLFCDSHSACGQCGGCRRLRAGAEGDLFSLRSNDSAKIKDEQVTEAIEHTKVRPIGKYRVVAVYEADRLTERAQNHLLKSLEEAREGVIYFMETAYPQRLLPTVLSRAIKIRGAHSRQLGSSLTDALLSADIAKKEAAFAEYRSTKEQKQSKAELVSMLVSAANDIALRLRERVATGDIEEARRLEKLVFELDRAVGNIERNGHFELNLDLLVSRQ